MIEKNPLDIKAICKSRRIRKIDIETPLLVPSFSSVVPEIEVKHIHEKLSDNMPNASLVSAYDIQYNNIKNGKIWVSDVVFIDSGNHEVEYLKSIDSKNLQNWSLSQYSRVISSLHPVTKVVLVNYDEIKPLKEQISDAINFFSNYSDYATCFLCKSTPGSMNQLDITGLIDNITLIEPFDILGLAEKELGSSLLNRCENLLRIRAVLNSKDLMIPIHIFGCLDPLNILSYFLCGADIFDGTVWLKFSFHSNIAIYMNNFAFLMGNWSESDTSVRASSFVLNLKQLTKLMYQLRRFTQEYDFGAFRIEETMCKEVKDLTKTAGLKY